MAAAIHGKWLPAAALALLAGSQAALAQPAPDTGVHVTVADWLPRWEEGGGWGLVPTGSGPGKWTAWSTEGVAAVPPGTYDLFWVQDGDHADTPMRLQSGIVVTAGAVTEIAINFGVTLEIADWVPPRTANGYWGVVVNDGVENNDVLFNWTVDGTTMVIPPGTYDYYWETDTTDGHDPIWITGGETTQPFSGIGAELQLIDGRSTVVRTTPNSPAAAAGVQAGDIVVAADEQALDGLDLTTVVGFLRGPGGSTVTLTIERGGRELTIPVVRAAVELQLRHQLDSGIRFVVADNVPAFQEGGRWLVTTPDATTADPWAWGVALDQPIVLGAMVYDVYWQQSAAVEPVLIAEDLSVIGELVELPVTLVDIHPALRFK
ncbi:MAG: S41 family peptidase [Bauldia sp.]